MCVLIQVSDAKFDLSPVINVSVVPCVCCLSSSSLLSFLASGSRSVCPRNAHCFCLFIDCLSLLFTFLFYLFTLYFRVGLHCYPSSLLDLSLPLKCLLFFFLLLFVHLVFFFSQLIARFIYLISLLLLHCFLYRLSYFHFSLPVFATYLYIILFYNVFTCFSFLLNIPLINELCPLTCACPLFFVYQIVCIF